MSLGEPVTTSNAEPEAEAAPVPAVDDPRRRDVLAGLLAASAAALIPPAVAAPAAGAGHNAFLAVSKTLTGRSSLDPTDASRLHDALLADDPQFATSVQALAAFLDQQKIDPLQLQHALDSGHPTLAALPRKIVTAWYTGIVGAGEKARCITYETALMNVVVADKLRPPSYCYGAPGSWVEKP